MSYKGHENVRVLFKSFSDDGMIKHFIEMDNDEIIDFQYIGQDKTFSGYMKFMIVIDTGSKNVNYE
ncbi:hypothetical protein [Staphylococcus xylosus]|uniref:hypothetical protein n=1 Tax=Staphylococcus xylosus TaxID=1288 RepID=UPI0011A2DA75|nr:hypothetical protein [Staphylococcus xylosus]MCE7786054.1 hypothetical protein [Staphylococcus xylosus]